MSIAYKSYCWVMGTTSFRTAQMNRKIEEQIRLLGEFRSIPGNDEAEWKPPLQIAYYRFMQDKGFLQGDAGRPAKDAREKTSGLVELGLVDDQRRLTAVGKELLEIASRGDFTPDHSNLIEVSRDSYLYFRQLLKGSKEIGAGYVRPFVAFLSLMSRIKPDGNHRRVLTDDEFTFLLPLCINSAVMDGIVSYVNTAREEGGVVDIEATILSVLMGMENYKEAMSTFVNATKVTEDLLCLVGMNRKSGKEGKSRYDAKYKSVYDALHEVAFEGATEQRLKGFIAAIDGLSGNIPRHWKDYFFETEAGHRLVAPFKPKFRNLPRSTSEAAFRESFFCVMHLLKAKATLNDYRDLNRRYFSLSDCVIFRDGCVSLSPLPAAFVDRVADWLLQCAFAQSGDLHDDIPLESIIGGAIPDKRELVRLATGKSMAEVEALGGVNSVMRSMRYNEFDAVLSSRLTKAKISQLLGLIEDRSNDDIVRAAVTDDADLPTIFEYLVGIAWYYVSGKKGDVLEYMNLSLGADFMPKTHAGGGEADIVWHYAAALPHYSKHTLLIEVTLAEKDSQRRMEMEPVSRHLGDYILAHNDESGTYCTFVSTHMNPNVVADFRGKRNQMYYDSADTSRKIKGMKIIPMDTNALRHILDKNLSYSKVHDIFDDNFDKDADPWQWYEEMKREICTSDHESV